MLAGRLLAICACTRVAAVRSRQLGSVLKPATTWRYADRDMRHSEIGIAPSAPRPDTSDQDELVPTRWHETMTLTTPDARERMIVTASLTSGVACVARGMPESVNLIDEIIRMDHVEWETILLVGTVEFHSSKAGPFPNHQLRVSVRPSTGFAALNYIDHDDPLLAIANSFNPICPLPAVK